MTDDDDSDKLEACQCLPACRRLPAPVPVLSLTGSQSLCLIPRPPDHLTAVIAVVRVTLTVPESFSLVFWHSLSLALGIAGRGARWVQGADRRPAGTLPTMEGGWVGGQW